MLKISIKWLMWKKVIQTKKYQTPFWDSTLETERKNVDHLEKISDTDNTVESYRAYKNFKNKHVKNIKRKKDTHMKRLHTI